MIDEKLLNSIISRFKDPSYSVYLTGFKQKEECGKSTLILDLEQVSPNFWKLLSVKNERIKELEDLLKANDIDIPTTVINDENVGGVVSKKLIIDTELAYNESTTLMESKLSGNVDILGLNTLPKTNIVGKIQHFFTTIVSKDVPNRITADTIKFHRKKKQIIITLPQDITQFKIDLYNDNPLEINDRITYKNGEDYSITQLDEQVIIDIFNEVLQKNTKELWFEIQYEYKKDNYNGYVELCDTSMASKINISFKKKFKTIPNINITSDIEEGKYFSGYSCEFIKDVNSGMYIGVIIYLENLRKKSSYPNISIAIMGGDAVD